MTTTFPGCKKFCTLQNVKVVAPPSVNLKLTRFARHPVQVTCEERIHFASVHTFLGCLTAVSKAYILLASPISSGAA